MKTKKYALVILTALTLTLFGFAEEIDFISLASEARWSSTATASLPFGREGQAREVAKYLSDARLEDGQTFPQVLHMHPPGQKDGIISGMFQNVRIPVGGAKLIIEGGFLEGAAGTDGVFFVAIFRGTATGQRGIPRTAVVQSREIPLCSFPAQYDRRIDRRECDLSGLEGQMGILILQVRAGNSADYDWAVWTEAKIISETVPPSPQPWGAEVRLINAYKGHDYRIDSVQFSPDGQYALTIDADNQAKVWQFPGGRVKLILRGNYFQPPSFSPDSRFVAIGKRGGAAEIWEILNENMIRTFRGHNGDVFTAKFSPNGRFLVTAGADGYAKVWDISAGTEAAAIRHSDRSGIAVKDAAFSPDGRYVVTVGEDNVARMWEIRF